MVLIDTSVWIRFLAGREPYATGLDELLERDEVVGHDMVYGELVLGERGARTRLLEAYGRITRATTVPHEEVVQFVRGRRLSGRGVGWVDVHLLASAVVGASQFWTADRRLGHVAEDLEVAYVPTTGA